MKQEIDDEGASDSYQPTHLHPQQHNKDNDHGYATNLPAKNKGELPAHSQYRYSPLHSQKAGDESDDGSYISSSSAAFNLPKPPDDHLDLVEHRSKRTKIDSEGESEGGRVDYVNRRRGRGGGGSRWTEEEKQALRGHFPIVGRNWTKLQTWIPNKSTYQISSFYYNNRQRLFSPFTYNGGNAEGTAAVEELGPQRENISHSTSGASTSVTNLPKPAPLVLSSVADPVHQDGRETVRDRPPKNSGCHEEKLKPASKAVFVAPSKVGGEGSAIKTEYGAMPTATGPSQGERGGEAGLSIPAAAAIVSSMGVSTRVTVADTPITAAGVQRKGRAHEELYCFCNGPAHGEMIACDNVHCKMEWFHMSCVRLAYKPLGKWFCSECSSSSSPVPIDEKLALTASDIHVGMIIEARASEKSTHWYTVQIKEIDEDQYLLSYHDAAGMDYWNTIENLRRKLVQQSRVRNKSRTEY